MRLQERANRKKFGKAHHGIGILMENSQIVYSRLVIFSLIFSSISPFLLIFLKFSLRSRFFSFFSLYLLPFSILLPLFSMFPLLFLFPMTLKSLKGKNERWKMPLKLSLGILVRRQSNNSIFKISNQTDRHSS